MHFVGRLCLRATLLVASSAQTVVTDEQREALWAEIAWSCSNVDDLSTCASDEVLVTNNVGGGTEQATVLDNAYGQYIINITPDWVALGDSGIANTPNVFNNQNCGQQNYPTQSIYGGWLGDGLWLDLGVSFVPTRLKVADMRRDWSFTMIELHCSLDGTDFTLVGGGDFSPTNLWNNGCGNQQEYAIAESDAVPCRFVKLLFPMPDSAYQANGGNIADVGLSLVEIYGVEYVPPVIDCVETTADTSTCTTVGQELYTLTTAAANGGAACTGGSTLCVAGDGSIPLDCVETTADTSTCTTVGRELYTLTTAAANGGATIPAPSPPPAVTSSAIATASTTFAVALGVVVAGFFC